MAVRNGRTAARSANRSENSPQRTQRHTKELNASVCLCGEMSINFVRILITLTNNKAHLLGQISAPDTPLLRIKVIGTVSDVFHKA